MLPRFWNEFIQKREISLHPTIQFSTIQKLVVRSVMSDVGENAIAARIFSGLFRGKIPVTQVPPEAIPRFNLRGNLL
jgi:hypothetical protein